MTTNRPSRTPAARATPDWERFQELVARIEESLAPKGATVTSPDRMRDLVTGRLREVDAAIRFQVGTTPILITVECRKRKGVQDDTWIEQLATKRGKIGAAKTIAVSATGFSNSATKTAALHGIELRSLEDRIGEEIVRQFLSGFSVTMLMTDYRVRTVAFILQDGSALNPAEFSPELMAKFATGDLDDDIATEPATGAVVTLNSLIRRIDDSDVPSTGEAVAKRFSAVFEANAIVVDTITGPQYIRRMEVEAEFKRRSIPAPATAMYEYSSPGQVHVRTVEATADLGEGKGMQVHVDISSPALDRRADQKRVRNRPRDSVQVRKLGTAG